MIGFISDIHGNYPALQAVLSELDKLNCKKLYFLGDVTGYYCMVNECMDALRERNVECILGNHDYYILNNEKCPRSYTVNKCLDFQRTVIREDNFKWLRTFRNQIKVDDISMVHGGWNDYLDEYISDFSFLDKKEGFSFFFSGHTHVQIERKGQYGRYYNPGSVGQPRDRDSRAAYAYMDDKKKVHLKRVEYDIDQIVFAMKKAGFEDRISSCLYHGVKIGEDGT